jgi:hypothetical protein
MPGLCIRMMHTAMIDHIIVIIFAQFRSKNLACKGYPSLMCADVAEVDVYPAKSQHHPKTSWRENI